MISSHKQECGLEIVSIHFLVHTPTGHNSNFCMWITDHAISIEQSALYSNDIALVSGIMMLARRYA